MKRKKTLFILFFSLFILLFLLFFALNPNRNLTSIEKILKNSILWIEDKIEIPFRYLIKENNCDNKVLEKTIDEKNMRLNELENFLNIKENFTDYDMIFASVIYRNSAQWYDIITINKGKKDGIEKGMAVIKNSGLIGRVVNVTKNTSTIKMLTSTGINNAISIKIIIDDKEIYGLLSEYKNGYFKIEGISENTEILENSTVVTTGMDNIFPSGILIGNVKYIEKDNFDLTTTVFVKPSVSFDNIYYVSVLKRREI